MEQYYYIGNENQRMGPFSLQELIEQQINGNTLIWKTGLTEWVPAKNVPEVATLLATDPTSTAQPQPESQPEKRPCPPSNLVWGILSTVLCCLPLGLISVYYSSKVEQHYHAGNYEKAQKAYEKSVNWCIASITISVLINLPFFSMFSFLQPLLILSML